MQGTARGGNHLERSETIEINDRGRLVAMLGPVPSASPLEHLRRTGVIEPATADFDELPEPMPSTAPMLPSEMLAGLLAAER